MDKIVISPNPVASLGFMLARPSLDGLGHVGNIYRKADADLFAEAPAMLAALRKAQELLRDLESPAHLYEGAALDDEMTAILARIDGPPTDPAGQTCEACGFTVRATPTDDSCDCTPTAQPIEGEG